MYYEPYYWVNALYLLQEKIQTFFTMLHCSNLLLNKCSAKFAKNKIEIGGANLVPTAKALLV